MTKFRSGPKVFNALYEKSIRNQRQSRDLTFKYERMNSELNLLNSTYQDKFARMNRQMKTHRRHLYSLITRTDTLTQSNDKLEKGETAVKGRMDRLDEVLKNHGDTLIENDRRFQRLESLKGDVSSRATVR